MAGAVPRACGWGSGGPPLPLVEQRGLVGLVLVLFDLVGRRLKYSRQASDSRLTSQRRRLTERQPGGQRVHLDYGELVRHRGQRRKLLGAEPPGVQAEAVLPGPLDVSA